MPCGPSRTRLFPYSWGFGCCGEEVMQSHSCESEFGRKGRGRGRGWWAICWEGARVVGCSWSLRLASLRATVVWSGFFRVHFWRWLWMNSASISCLTLVPLDALRCTYFVRDLLTGLSGFFVGRCEISLWDLILLGASFSCESSRWEFTLFLVHNLLMWCDAYWAVARFANEMWCFSGVLWDFQWFS